MVAFFIDVLIFGEAGCDPKLTSWVRKSGCSTLDMRGSCRRAKPAGSYPSHGGVGPQANYYRHMTEYINAAVTFIVGLAAFVIYWLTKRAERSNAAAIIVMDIRRAEQAIVATLERGTIDRTIKPVLNANNWAMYKHLFASDFSYDELEQLDRFFDSAVEIELARKRMQETFYTALNAKAALLQQRILDIEDLTSDDGQDQRKKLIEKFNGEGYAFDPQDPKGTVFQNLQLMGRPSRTPVFEKLKRISRIAA